MNFFKISRKTKDHQFDENPRNPNGLIRFCSMNKISKLFSAEKIPRVVYFFMPLCFTFAMNVVFFVLTALKIRSVRHELSEAGSYDENAKQSANFNANTHR